MVAPISVFPDVGNAFFGSYRGARQARLQEQAMRAQMAALRADRERESRARGAFAELVAPPTPELTVDNTAVESRLFGMPRLGAETRGLDPSRRSELERTLASSDPSLYSAARQMRAGPEIPEEVYENLGAAVARGDISAEGAVSRLVSNGVPQQEASARLGMYVVPSRPEISRVIDTERGQIAVDQYGNPVREFGARPNRSPSTTINVEAAEGPDLAGVLRETDISGLRREELEAARSRISAAQNVLDTVSDLSEQIEVAGGSTQGALGWARRVTSGAQGQLAQLAEYSPALAGMAQTATQDAIANADPDFSSERWFNDELGGADYLFHTLAYMVAKMRDDSGRVSDADMRNAISSLGGGIFGNDEQLASALRIVQRQAQRSYDRGISTERRIFDGQDMPDRGAGDASIDELLNRYAPEGG